MGMLDDLWAGTGEFDTERLRRAQHVIALVSTHYDAYCSAYPGNLAVAKFGRFPFVNDPHSFGVVGQAPCMQRMRVILSSRERRRERLQTDVCGSKNVEFELTFQQQM